MANMNTIDMVMAQDRAGEVLQNYTSINSCIAINCIINCINN